MYFGLLAFALVLTLCACGISRKPVGSAPEEPSTASGDVTATEKPGELDSDVRMDLTAFQDSFPAYMEFGARMEITSNGQISWGIGIEGGTGTYTQDGDTLTADIASDVDQQHVSDPDWGSPFAALWMHRIESAGGDNQKVGKRPRKGDPL